MISWTWNDKLSKTRWAPRLHSRLFCSDVHCLSEKSMLLHGLTHILLNVNDAFTLCPLCGHVILSRLVTGSCHLLQVLLFVFSILRKVAWDYGRLALVTDADRYTLGVGVAWGATTGGEGGV